MSTKPAAGQTLMIYPFRYLAGVLLSVVFFTFFNFPSRAETLFKIVTVKDEIIVGLSDSELKEYGGDAGGIAAAIAARGSLTLWQYAVRQDKSGEREVAPRQKIGVLANSSLRVEPYKQPFKVIVHE